MKKISHGTARHIQSGVFTVGEHDWAIRYYPDGFKHGDAGYMSLYLAYVSNNDNPDGRDGPKEAIAIFKFEMLDEDEGVLLRCSSNEPFTFKSSTPLLGWSRMMKTANFELRFVKDDCFTVRCTVTVVKPPRVPASKVMRSFAAPPSDLYRHLGELLESGDGEDVIFSIGGKAFVAHRCVLAARSPVFKAQLFGPMKEKGMQCIHIEDMEAVVFEAMLHFVYWDSLHQPLGELTKESLTWMLQHLLVAADRYGLEKLRLICEDELCRGVDVRTVATTLALAEQHHCRELKNACLGFISSPDVLIAVMKTKGFEHLRISCPEVLVELLEAIS